MLVHVEPLLSRCCLGEGREFKNVKAFCVMRGMFPIINMLETYPRSHKDKPILIIKGPVNCGCGTISKTTSRGTLSPAAGSMTRWCSSGCSTSSSDTCRARHRIDVNFRELSLRSREYGQQPLCRLSLASGLTLQRRL